MKKNFFLILLICISFFSISQNVKINGIGKTYENKEIGVWINNDFICNTQKKLTFSNIDSIGNFVLEFNSKDIQYITLKIEKNITSMYIEPNANYDIILFPPDSTTYQNPNIEHDIKLSISLKSKTEINALTIDYEKRFDNFLSVDYKEFVRRTPQTKIDSFEVAMNDFYSTVNHFYFKNYITYTIATLKEETKFSEKKLFANYLNNKPILYNHPEYMNFFNTFYKQKLQTFALSKNGTPLNFTINNRGSCSATMEVMKRDAFLVNDTICELVLIKGLYESYYDGTFKRQSITAMLRQIANESKIEMHKQIAQNILNSFSKLQIGSKTPFFELPDKTGITHSLDDLRTKKYVYVMFYGSNCSSCLEQMKVIPSLKKTYGERIEFVSISTDKTNAELKNFQTKNSKYDWIFLYDNSNGKLKNDYEIKSLPAYFLISPEGKFIQVPAESPNEDIDRVFYDLTKIKSKLHNVGAKTNQ